MNVSGVVMVYGFGDPSAMCFSLSTMAASVKSQGKVLNSQAPGRLCFIWCDILNVKRLMADH